MITIEKKGLVLTAEAKAYAFDGRSGTSYKARVLVEGDVYPLKCTAEQIQELQPHVNKSVDLVFTLSAPKENVRLEYVSVKKEKAA